MFKNSVLTAQKNGFFIALAMLFYALILKLIGQQTGITTIGYYLLFVVGIITFVRQYIKKNTGVTFINQSGHLLLLSAFSSLFYSVWVVFNSRIIINGPIPNLVASLKTLRAREAAGEDVTEAIATTIRFIDNPEIFAANVGTMLLLVGLLIGLVSILIIRQFGTDKLTSLDN